MSEKKKKPSTKKKNVISAATQAAENSLEDLVEGSLDRIYNDDDFLAKIDEVIKSKILELLPKIDISHCAKLLQDNMEGSIDQFEFCNLSEILDDALCDALKNLTITIVTSAKTLSAKKKK